MVATLVAYVYRSYYAATDVAPIQEAFEVRDLAGRGKGMIALRDIKASAPISNVSSCPHDALQRGELLLKEKPLFVVPSTGQ